MIKVDTIKIRMCDTSERAEKDHRDIRVGGGSNTRYNKRKYFVFSIRLHFTSLDPRPSSPIPHAVTFNIL